MRNLKRGASTLSPGLVAAVIGVGILLIPVGGIGTLFTAGAAVFASAAVMGAVTKPRKK
jgi:hypothetical protein